MSLHTPYFFIKAYTPEESTVCHNCDGSINFMATDQISDKTKRLIEMAFAEGERRMAKKLRDLLEVKNATD